MEGVVTYYVTALDQFRSLRSCAQDGVSSAVQAVRIPIHFQ